MRTLLVTLGLSVSLMACMSADDHALHPAKHGCYIGGCSSQICSDRDDGVSTCEWTEQYACYREATCDRQADGACDWTATPELAACLASH
jgi:hypothetical protein